jgi:aspartate kinase
MITLVQKYGGTSVETPHHLLGVARRILEEKRRGSRLIVVVSAMGQATDELIALANRVSTRPPRREMDMLLTAGERISMALLAIALESLGARAISFTGSQSGIITDDRHSDARIAEIRPSRIEECLAEERIVIVAGFQGVSLRKEVTTLGRGGSDTTAVALAVRFGSPWCEIYTDVHGVLTADPRIVPRARTVRRIGYDTAITLSHLGAGVIFRRSVILARKYHMPIRVLCSIASGEDTWIGPVPEEAPVEIRPPMESDSVLSIALEGRCISVRLEGKMQLGAMLALLDEGPAWTWIETWRHGDRNGVRAVRPESSESGDLRDRAAIAGLEIEFQRDLAVVSLVGEGILAQPALARDVVDALAAAGILVHAARTGSLFLSFLIDREHGAEATRLLHERYVESPRAS